MALDDFIHGSHSGSIPRLCQWNGLVRRALSFLTLVLTFPQAESFCASEKLVTENTAFRRLGTGKEASFIREGKEKQKHLSSTSSSVCHTAEVLTEFQAVLNTTTCAPDCQTAYIPTTFTGCIFNYNSIEKIEIQTLLD